MCIVKNKIVSMVLLSIVVILIVMGGFSQNAMAALPGERDVVPLSKLVGFDRDDQFNLKENQINLMESTNSFMFNLPISKRMDISKITLHLDFIHSTVLLKNRSQVRVVVNGIVVAQIGFDPVNPHVIADIPIPFETFREGYNAVEFKVAQHYSEDCEDPAAPELWTQINTIKSYFYLEYDYRPIRFTLASLDEVFDRKLKDYTVTIMRPKETAQYDDVDLKWGALAAQGVSLRLEYRPVNLKMATAVQRDSLRVFEEMATSNYPLLALDQTGLKNDVVLIGTRDELRPLFHPRLRDSMAAAISGPFLSIMPAADPRFQIVIISGNDASEVTQAVQAFAFVRSSFPDSTFMVVNELNLPSVEPDTFPGIIQPGVRYTFKEFGYRTTSGGSYKRRELKFVAPPDLLIRKEANVSIKLDFTYGAAFRKDSVLNIYLNGIFEKAISLDNDQGARFHDYEFYISASSILPGTNVLRFEPVIPPLVTSKCTAVQEENAMLTIWDSSSIELPLLDRYVKLPDLALFSRTGYPFTSTADGEEMGIVVRGQNSGSILAAWQMMAKLSQITAMPLYKAIISFRAIDGRHLLIVGDRPSLYEDDMRNSPVKLGEIFEFDYPVGKGSRKGATTLLDRTKSFFSPLRTGRPGFFKNVYTNIKFKASLDRDALLVGYQSVDDPNRLVMLLTSGNPDSLKADVRRLMSPDFWDMMDDNLAIWNEDDYSLKTYRTKAEFFKGKTTFRNSMAFYYSIHRVQFLIGLFVLVLVLAWLIHRQLNSYKKKRQQCVTEIAP